MCRRTALTTLLADLRNCVDVQQLERAKLASAAGAGGSATPAAPLAAKAAAKLLKKKNKKKKKLHASSQHLAASAAGRGCKPSKLAKAAKGAKAGKEKPGKAGKSVVPKKQQAGAVPSKLRKVRSVNDSDAVSSLTSDSSFEFLPLLSSGFQSAWFEIVKLESNVNVWTRKAEEVLGKPSLVRDVLALTEEGEALFPAVSVELLPVMRRRVEAVRRWVPREKKGISKRLRVSALVKLLSERLVECQTVESVFSKHITADVDRAVKWSQRFNKAIESKADKEAFAALATELVGPNRVLADAKDTRLIKQFEETYCLCKAQWQDNIFMICCDSCEEWFHDSCVSLTQQQARKLKTYMCPSCCKEKGLPYTYGPTILEKRAAAAKAEAETKAAKAAAGKAAASARVEGGKEKQEKHGKSERKLAKSVYKKRKAEAMCASKADVALPKPVKVRLVHSASIYLVLLFETLRERLSAEASKAVWMILNGFVNRPMNAALHEELIQVGGQCYELWRLCDAERKTQRGLERDGERDSEREI